MCLANRPSLCARSVAPCESLAHRLQALCDCSIAEPFTGRLRARLNSRWARSGRRAHTTRAPVATETERRRNRGRSSVTGYRSPARYSRRGTPASTEGGGFGQPQPDACCAYSYGRRTSSAVRVAVNRHFVTGEARFTTRRRHANPGGILGLLREPLADRRERRRWPRRELPQGRVVRRQVRERPVGNAAHQG